MGSAVLVVAIVAVWVVVLLPMFLRGHDRRTELGSAERFAGAMRVLSRRRGRRGGLVDSRYDLRPSERRAQAISKAFGASSVPMPAPPVPRAEGPRQVAPRRMTRERVAARAAARRRGLLVLGGVLLAMLLVAAVVGGIAWAFFGLVLILCLAGFAQLRAGAIADRALASGARTTARTAAVSTQEPVSPRQPMPESRPERMKAPVPQAFAMASGSDVQAPVVRGPGKQIVFDAVSETPVVEKPRVRRVESTAAAAGMPDDFYERPVSPPAPEQVRRSYQPLLDEVDTDPAALTDGLEALDAILGRASGE